MSDWKPRQETEKEVLFILQGIDKNIIDLWPSLCMYFTANGWIRKERY